MCCAILLKTGVLFPDHDKDRDEPRLPKEECEAPRKECGAALLIRAVRQGAVCICRCAHALRTKATFVYLKVH